MAYLLAGDFDTHIYSENRDEITRGDNSIIYEAIEAAITEAKSYMARYDVVKLFGYDNTDPVFEDGNLKNKVKDLAVWHLVSLGNANIKMDVARSRYEDAISWFKMVTRNHVTPGWPLKEDDPSTDANESRTIEWNSEQKRKNHY